MGPQPVVHQLWLPAGTDAAAVERLVRARYPSATRTPGGGLALTRHSTLSAAESDPRGHLVRTASTLRERGDAPLPGQVDPVGYFRVFPDGVPVREERRVLDLLVGLARRLGGSLVVGEGRGTTLLVDRVGRVDLRVLSPVALDPHQVLAAVQTVEPSARLAMDGTAFEPLTPSEDDLPDLVRTMDPVARAALEAFSRRVDAQALAGPDVLDAFAVEVPLGGLGTVVVEAHAEDEPPPSVRGLGWDEVQAYELRWLPSDPLQAETDAPDDAFRADRAAVLPRVRALTRAVAELAPGEVRDADGLPVDRWSL